MSKEPTFDGKRDKQCLLGLHWGRGIHGEVARPEVGVRAWADGRHPALRLEHKALQAQAATAGAVDPLQCPRRDPTQVLKIPAGSA